MPPKATAAHQCGLARSGFPDRALFLFIHQRGLLGCQMPFKRLRRPGASERNRRQPSCSSNVFGSKHLPYDIWPIAMASCINPPITARRGQHLRVPCESAARRVLSWAIAVNENANWEATERLSEGDSSPRGTETRICWLMPQYPSRCFSSLGKAEGETSPT